MGNIPLPALSLKSPEQPDTLSSFRNLVAIKGMLGQQQGQQQEQQMRGLQIQEAQLSLADHQAQTKAMQAWDGKDYNDIPTLVKQNGGSLNAVLDATQKIVARQQQVATLDETTLKNTQARNDQYRGRIQAIIDAPDDQKQTLWANEVAAEQKAGAKLGPGITDQYPGDDTATVLANHFALGSVLAKEATEKMSATGAAQRGQAALGELNLNQQKFAQSPEELTRRSTAVGPDGQPTPDALQAKSILAAQTKQAGATAGAEAAAKFPYELQLKQQELAQNPVFAVNPKTGRRELTTVEDAKANGFTNPVKVSQGQVENETTLNAQLNDLQLNTSRYKAALNAMGPLSKSDVANMTRVLSDKSINSFLANELTLGVALDQVSQGEKASAWNALSPDKQAALIGSLRMKNSALLFQKVSTGMGRASKEAMEIEIANMPSPIEGATVGNQKMQSFQENIDQMASRSVKLPWQDSSQDVKARIEGQAVDQYNKQQAAKPQGRYRAKETVTVGQNIQLPNTPGLSRVKKVYSDGTFDADQKP